MSKANLPWNAQYTITPDVVEDIATDAGVVTYLGFWQNGGGPYEGNRFDQERFQIKRVTKTITVNGAETITEDITEYAEGSANYDKAWSQRATYNYSFLR